ncbi:MAG: M48 family metallopeptidase [Acidimicrobiia bacterium]|nr:M48 family metallopeptidase [Acidimicrobiia bacterium]
MTEINAVDHTTDANLRAQPEVLTPAPFEVRVTRSKRRKKTAEASLRGNLIDIRIPASSTQQDERHFVDHFVATFEKRRGAALIDLDVRAQKLADDYGLPVPDSIRWVSNQNRRWGSCTPADRSIRLSDRMAHFPSWVIDYVIIHELAHLVEIEHNATFWSLVEPYPLAERARGYLIAKAEDRRDC